MAGVRRHAIQGVSPKKAQFALSIPLKPIGKMHSKRAA